MEANLYTVRSYSRCAHEKCNGQVQFIEGCEVEEGWDTLREAKARAKYLLSERARISAENSERDVYATVHRRGECIFDTFAL